jgi:chloride channel protein, CIC family
MNVPPPDDPRRPTRRSSRSIRVVRTQVRRGGRRLLHALRGGRDFLVARFTALRLGTEPTLVAFAVVIGVGSALGVLAFYKGISLAHTAFVLWPAVVLPELGLLAFRPVVTAVTFATASWTMRVIGRGYDGMNVPDIQAAVEHRGGRIAPRPAMGRTLASAITIGGGGSAGAEGPVVLIGATLGSWLGRMFRFKPGRLRVLVACGAAGAIAAAFNAPLAGAFFALEEILGTFAGGYFSPVVVAAVVAAVVARGIFGAGPAFPVPGELGELGGWEIGLLLPALGVVCALMGTMFVRTYFGIDAFVRSGRIDTRWLPWLGGALVGIIVYVTQGAVASDGHLSAPLDLFGRMPWWTLIGLAAAKIVATSITLNAGGSGGVFTPALFVGATTGGAFGVLVQSAFPAAQVDPALYALAGMGAMVAGATGAPITGILLVFEMTHDFELVMPLMLAVVVTKAVMRRYEKDSLYSGWLRRHDIELNREEIA